MSELKILKTESGQQVVDYEYAKSIIEQQQARIAELERYNVRLANESHEKDLKIDELSATVERLREAGTKLRDDIDLSKIVGACKRNFANEWDDVISATPRQNLNAVKRTFLENFQQWALDFVCSPDFEPLKRKVFRKLNSGAQGQQVMPHNDPEYCGLLALFGEYANTKYPSGNQCTHQWVNAENKVVKNGYVCIKCHAVCSDIKYPSGKE